MSTEQNKEIVRRFWAVTDKNVDELDELLIEDYVHHDPALPPDVQNGRENYKRVFLQFWTAFPDLHCTIESLIAQGDRVACRLRWQGTHGGELMGIPATGKRVDFGMLEIHRLADGKIAEGWVNFDALGMLTQLGVVPQPA